MKRRDQFFFVASILSVLGAYGCEYKDPMKIDCSHELMDCATGQTCLEVTDPLDETVTTHLCCKPVTDGSCTAEAGFTAYSCDYQDELYIHHTMCHQEGVKPEDKGCLATGCDEGYTCNTTTRECVENSSSEGCKLTGCGEGERCNETTLKCEPETVDPDEPQTVECGELTISDATKTCELTGSGSTIILRGTVLGYEKTWEGGAVAIQGNKITYVGCGNDLDMNNATIITCPNGVISPSLINGHDHLTYSNTTPATWGDERFDHRHDWRKGYHNHTKLPSPQTDNNEVVELRAIMGGTTSIFGSGKVNGLARNLDKETIEGVQSIYQTFPLNDSSMDYAKVSSCADYEYHKSVTGFDEGCPYGPHVAEGINQAAYNELLCLSGNGIGTGDTGYHDIFKPNTAIIHGTAATPEIIAQMQQNRVKLIWSPRTNIALYGDTAQAPLYDNLGVTIGLGTDWIYSGSANMLRELACIDYLNRYHYNSHFSDYELWLMPTYNNAVAFGLEHALGQLKEGYLADIAIFKATETRKKHRAIIEAENADVALVMVDGNMIYGDENIMSKGDSIDVCGSAKKVDINANGGSYSLSATQSAAIYPLFFCAPPQNEPSCVPSRTRTTDTTAQETTLYTGSTSDENDIDGDGIPNDRDNCPNMFNPIRPQDTDRKQADYDGDGIGDICDKYPTCATNDETCPVFDAKDRDRDGVVNTIDNCPDTANPDQADADNDGLGDACDTCNDAIDRDGDGLGDECDACPDDGNNEDGTGCSLQLVSLSDLRQNYLNGVELPTLAKVRGVVTAINSKYDGSALSSFFIQDPEKPAAILVYSDTEAAKVHVGDLVEVKGTLEVYFSLIELKPTRVEVLSSDHTIAPLQLTAAQTTENTSPDAGKNAYDSVLVTVSGLTVNKLDTTYKNGNAYLCTDENGDTAYIDDYVMGTPALESLVELGATYDVTGILVYDFNLSKIAPRSEADFSSDFGLKSVTASANYADLSSEVTITITMNDVAESDVTVAITCGDAICDSSIVIPAGKSSAEMTITMASKGNTTVQATYNEVVRAVTINGVDQSVPVSIASVTPSSNTLATGSTGTATVKLNRVDTHDTVVTLSSSDVSVASVPASVTVLAESLEATFDITVVATDADKTASISAAIGASAPVSFDITTFVPANIEYNLTFSDFGGTSSYSDSYAKTYDNGITVTASGAGASSKDPSGIAMTGAKSNKLVIENLDGVGNVKVGYTGWSSSGKLDVIVGDNTQTITANTDEKGTFDYNFDNNNATSITIKPQSSSENGKNRFVITSVSWTTNK